MVDDKEVNLQILEQVLAPLGFDLVQAMNGREGLEQAKTANPDLIITDLKMPEMDGFAMTQRLRNSPEQEVIIIASSASVSEEDKMKAITEGCNDFLPKPVEIDKLLSCLQKYLKLEWVYEKTETKLTEREDVTAAFIPPPDESLRLLYEAVKIGDFEAIENQAEAIKQRDSQYTIFCDRILQLTSEFDETGLTKLLQEYLGIAE
ncbi:response regulator [Spirulina sp. CS-785/01]|uniref:response regulator n=1 Tax=Spirulina sp. CS-785/01 TaxID=3021716 RepID=UPI00232CED20|nr:response regulator [Spirulina sp. CS-785/01]MDB9314463.1 response regulator [Spirulina sp. CS-785/01]